MILKEPQCCNDNNYRTVANNHKNHHFRFVVSCLRRHQHQQTISTCLWNIVVVILIAATQTTITMMPRMVSSFQAIKMPMKQLLSNCYFRYRNRNCGPVDVSSSFTFIPLPTTATATRKIPTRIQQRRYNDDDDDDDDQDHDFPSSRFYHHSRTITTTSMSATTTSSTEMYEMDRSNNNSYNNNNMYSDDDDIYEEDTIYALATGGIGTSSSSSSSKMMTVASATAIAIIRLSGSQSLPIIQSLLMGKILSQNDANETEMTKDVPILQPRRVYLRKLYHPRTSEILDQVIVIYYQKPFSYTGEDCIEIQCHGSRAVIHDIVSTFQECFGSSSSSSGSSRRSTTKSPSSNQHYDNPLYIRLAEPGEFTQRAYRNGKMDLLQIEALSDLIQADTSVQRKQALLMYDGQVSEIYLQWRQVLIMALAHAEAIIDFGDDESLEENQTNPQQQQSNIWGRITIQIQDLIRNMEQQLQNERRGELVRDGIKIAIIGPPNVGKSSLLNLLALREAAIVSNIAGTTRDIVEVPINLNGMKCIVQDTAGVRSTTTDMIEQIGIDRAITAAQQADIVVAVIDATDPTTGWETLSNLVNVNSDQSSINYNGDGEQENNIISPVTTSLNPKHLLVVYNKADLFTTESESTTVRQYPQATQLLSQIGGCIDISCTTQQGIDTLIQTLTQRVMDRVNGNDTADDETPSSPSSLSSTASTSTTMITRTRHRQHIMASKEALQRFVVLSQQGPMMIDMAAEELRLAASELGRITGAVDVEDVLDKLFADFCIGK